MEKMPIKYLQVKEDIEKRISDGEYRSGQRIPSERTLCTQFNMSRMTVRQAINELVKEGKLYREKGRGTFVSSPHFLQRNVKKFYRYIKRKRIYTAYTDSRILYCI